MPAPLAALPVVLKGLALAARAGVGAAKGAAQATAQQAGLTPEAQNAKSMSGIGKAMGAAAQAVAPQVSFKRPNRAQDISKMSPEELRAYQQSLVEGL